METTSGEHTFEIKQETDQEEINIKNFLVELHTLRGVLTDAESKFGLISSKCVRYLEDYDLSCDLHRMMIDGLKSISTGLDEVEQKFRAKYDLNQARKDDDNALFQLLLSHEVTMKSEGDEEGDNADNKPSGSTSKPASSPEKATASSDFDSDDEIPNPHIPHYYYESPCDDDDHDKDDLTPGPLTLQPRSIRIRNLIKTRRSVTTTRKTKHPPPPKIQITRQKKLSNPATSTDQPPTLNPPAVSQLTQESTRPLKKRGRKPTLDKSPVSCPICHKTLAYNGLALHTQRCHTVRPMDFKCTLCPREFPTKGQLKNHAKIHSECKSFVCELCGWSFHLNSNLQQHMRKHQDERPFKCTQCEDTFKFSQALSLHVQAIHSEKSNQCTLCGKLFGTLTKLKSHERCVHQGVRSYPCHLCGKAFKRGDNLKYHVKTHSNPASKYRGLNKPRV